MRRVALACALLGAACSRGPEPVFVPGPLQSEGLVELEGAQAGEVEVDAEGASYEAEIALPQEVWNFAEQYGVYSAWARIQPPGSDLDDGLELLVEGRAMERIKGNSVDVFSTEVAPGQYLYHSGAIVLRTLDGEAPRDARLLQRGGHDAEGVLQLGGLTSEGLLVGPGQAAEYRLPATREGVVSLLAGLHGFRADGLPVEGRFEATLDGVPLAELELSGGRGATVRCWSMPVPDGAAGRVLRVGLEAPLSLGCLAIPRIEYPGLVEADERQDLVLFSADTFRADNLAAYADRLGTAGERPPGLTPYLDELADRSALFLNMWSPSSWTLPAHASMFTGLWPPQHTASDARRALPSKASTLAETLSGAGWRTVAVTGGGYCSAGRGLDQGFEVFYESELGFDDIAQKALELAAFDDGRPLFLFVHTFRVHSPYRTTQATLERFDLDVEPRVDFGTIATEVFDAALANPDRLKEFFAESVKFLPRMRALYLGGVAEFDAEFRAFHEGLLSIGRLDDRGLLAFTSDHGEQFGENERFGHSTELWEAVLRVPLFFLGPDIEPGARATPASLVDLMPTLLSALGVPEPEGLSGRNLFAEELEPELFAFHQGNPLSKPATARIQGGAKRLVIEGEPGALQFDLERDPLGLDPSQAGPGWGAGAAGLERASTARFATVDASMDDFTRERLRQLGYLDGEEPESDGEAAGD